MSQWCLYVEELYIICILIGVTELGVKTFVAKIGDDNIPSRNLFEKKLQFHQVVKEINYNKSCDNKSCDKESCDMFIFII